MGSIAFYPYKEDPQIRKMRVQAWFKAVTMESGLSARELEEKFREDSGKKVKRSCIWNKYRRGEIVPRGGHRDDGQPNLLERVEASYPETSEWLLSPIWRVADPAPMEMSELRQVYAGLPGVFRQLFIAPGKATHGRFWRSATPNKVIFEVLSRKPNLEAITAALALVKETETRQCLPSHNAAVSGTMSLLKMLTRNVPTHLRPLVESGLFNYLPNAWTAD